CYTFVGIGGAGGGDGGKAAAGTAPRGAVPAARGTGGGAPAQPPAPRGTLMQAAKWPPPLAASGGPILAPSASSSGCWQRGRAGRAALAGRGPFRTAGPAGVARGGEGEVEAGAVGVGVGGPAAGGEGGAGGGVRRGGDVAVEDDALAAVARVGHGGGGEERLG